MMVLALDMCERSFFNARHSLRNALLATDEPWAAIWDRGWKYDYPYLITAPELSDDMARRLR